jgi:hypothetical protein
MAFLSMVSPPGVTKRIAQAGRSANGIIIRSRWSGVKLGQRPCMFFDSLGIFTVSVSIASSSQI